MSTITSRLNRLTAVFPTPRCPDCGNHPTRLKFIDERTDDVVSDTHPLGVCPGCGRTPYREVHIVSSVGWNNPAALV